ncbi:MAG TPA: hypothetical protein VKR62_06830 [Roseiarcus sp.]|nr:hypothetical protein [Roseiarcus sp.]
MSFKIRFALALVGPLAFLVQPGMAQQTLPRSWPIENGFKRQPTRNELKALHQQDVPPADAREIDRLYDELMRTNDGTHRPGDARTR